jgi:hypothetical protein
MSHFTKIKTQMVVKEYLIAALESLGYAWEEGDLTIRGFAGARTPVELRVPTRSRGYEIGFRKQGEAYEIVADWWGIKETSAQAFQQQLARQYAYQAARAKLEAQGFALVNEEKGADGRLHLVLRRVS